MATKGCGTPLRGSGKDQTVWKLEWTYSDGSGAVSIDSAQSDEDPSIATPVADGGTGVTNIVFPKSSRAWVLHCSIEPATEATGSNHRQVSPVDLNATAGTLELSILESDTAAAIADPESGSRGRLILLLERP